MDEWNKAWVPGSIRGPLEVNDGKCKMGSVDMVVSSSVFPSYIKLDGELDLMRAFFPPKLKY